MLWLVEGDVFYHGTSQAAARSIAHNGFDLARSGGRIYLARLPNYAHRFSLLRRRRKEPLAMLRCLVRGVHPDTVLGIDDASLITVTHMILYRA